MSWAAGDNLEVEDELGTLSSRLWIDYIIEVQNIVAPQGLYKIG